MRREKIFCGPIRFARVHLLGLCLAMNLIGTSTAFGQVVNYDFLTSDGGWTGTSYKTAVWSWTATGANPGWSTTGWSHPSIISESAINYLISPVFTLSGSGPNYVYGTFAHSFNFDGDSLIGYDGGFLEYKVNSGDWKLINSSLVGLNGSQGYNRQLNVIGISAFSAQMSNVTTEFALGTTLTPESFSPGDTVQFRFVGYWDESVMPPNPNWVITSASFNTVQAVPEPGSMILTGLALAGMGGAAWRRRKGKTAPVETP